MVFVPVVIGIIMKEVRKSDMWGALKWRSIEMFEVNHYLK